MYFISNVNITDGETYVNFFFIFITYLFKENCCCFIKLDVSCDSVQLSTYNMEGLLINITKSKTPANTQHCLD